MTPPQPASWRISSNSSRAYSAQTSALSEALTAAPAKSAVNRSLLAKMALMGPAFIAGAGFVLSSTAVIMSMLQERGELAGSDGQKAVSILLFEDLSIVPLLALVAWFAPDEHGGAGWLDLGVGAAAVATVLLAISLVVIVTLDIIQRRVARRG